MKSKNWKVLRDWINAGIKQQKILTLTTAVVFPIIEAIFVNLITGSDQSAVIWPLSIALIVLGTTHLALVLALVWPTSNYPFQCVADSVEAEVKIGDLEAELIRKSKVQVMLRSLIETLNLQTCAINATDPDVFCNGLSPIICNIISDVSAIFGVISNQFTLELYCDSDQVAGKSQCQQINGLQQMLFYSPVGGDPCRPVRLKKRSPCAWGAQRVVPGICRYTEDLNFFSDNGQRPKDCYFQVICTVPVFVACSNDVIGVLVLTSMQEENLASDVIENLQFVSSLISQYISAHNRCVWDWEASQARANKKS